MLTYRAIISDGSAICRESIANMVAVVIEADSEWKAYKPNEWDDSYWTVDRNNDWKIKFVGGSVVELVYRYKTSSLGKPLFDYLCERFRWIPDMRG